jgi:hypothetical protein
MGYTQRVTTKDKQGRITSSWLRVRVVVPDGLPQSLPPPYTGNRNLTKKVHTDREHAEWTERFLAMIEGARGWDTIHRELAAVNGLSLEGFIARGCIPVFAKLDRKIDGILASPLALMRSAPKRKRAQALIPAGTASRSQPLWVPTGRRARRAMALSLERKAFLDIITEGKAMSAASCSRGRKAYGVCPPKSSTPCPATIPTAPARTALDTVGRIRGTPANTISLASTTTGNRSVFVISVGRVARVAVNPEC